MSLSFFPASFNLYHNVGCADNGEADEQQKHSESQIQSSSTASGMSHTVMTTPNVQYASPPQYGAGHAVVLSQNLIFTIVDLLHVQ